MKDLTHIGEQFQITGTIINIVPLGNGLINKTYKVHTFEDNAPDYVLQQINHHVFKDVAGLQRNIEIVTDHLREKQVKQGGQDMNRQVLKFIPLQSDNSKTYYFDGENYWRISEFICDSFSKEEVTAESAYDAGCSFGRFQSDLSDLKADLIETIPDFHNIEFRLKQLREALEHPSEGRWEECRNVVEVLLKDASIMTTTQDLFRKGLLPKRVCHCDTKVNNILFDSEGKVMCVIDLDTVMPSFVFSDYGDFLRTAAATLAEDNPDYDNIGFRMDIFRSFTKGYLSEAKDFLTPTELEYLPHAVALFPYMQAVRFITDFIEGDKYYSVAFDDHNLVRAKNQLALYQLTRKLEPQLRKIISDCLQEF